MPECRACELRSAPAGAPRTPRTDVSDGPRSTTDRLSGLAGRPTFAAEDDAVAVMPIQFGETTRSPFVAGRSALYLMSVTALLLESSIRRGPDP